MSHLVKLLGRVEAHFHLLPLLWVLRLVVHDCLQDVDDVAQRAFDVWLQGLVALHLCHLGQLVLLVLPTLVQTD